MKQERKAPQAQEIWSTALATLKGTRRQTVCLLIAGLILPQVALSLLFDIHSGAVVSELRAIFTAKLGATGSPPIPFTALIAPAITYVSRLAVFLVAAVVTLAASYFALVHTAVDHLRAAAPRGALRAWLAGLRTALPGGLVLALGLVFLMMLGQVLIAPAVLAAALGLVMPVILVAEKRGAVRSLWAALTLKYVRGSAYTGWAVLFNLLSLGAVVYGALAGAGLFAEFLLNLDERFGLPRAAWAATFPGFDFGPVYLGVTVLETCLSMALIAAVPALTAALYFLVVARREIGRA